MLFDLLMRDAPQSSQVEIQEYLDDISSLKLTKEESDWYNIDVAAMLNHVNLHGHEINEVDGSSLLFWKRVLYYVARNGRDAPFPKEPNPLLRG